MLNKAMVRAFIDRTMRKGTPFSRSAALVAMLALVWFVWPTVRTVGQVALAYPDYSHCVLVPFLASFLAWTRRDELLNRSGGLRWPGIPLAAAGVLMSLLGWWYEVALQPGSFGYVFLLGIGAVFVFSGVLWSFLGTRRLLVLVVPVAFLLFAIPLPDSVIEFLTAPLRTIATVGATFLLQKGGLAAHREGNIIEMANGSVGVNDACSGIRSVWVLLTFAVFMYAVMRMSKFRALLLLLAVPMLAIAANLIRVGLSAWAVACGHPKLAEGMAHDFVGLVTVATASAGIVWLGLVLSPSRGTPPLPVDGRGRAVGLPAAQPQCFSGIALLVICVMMILGCLARMRIESHYRQHERAEPVPVARQDLTALREALEAKRQVTILDLTTNEVEMLKPDDRLVVSCSDPSGTAIYLRVLYWKPELERPTTDRLVLRPHNPDVCFPAAGWISDSLFEHEREFAWSNGERVGVRIFRKLNRELMMFFWQDFGPTDERLFVPAEMKDRLKALIRSWTVPPLAFQPARYAVVITAETGTDTRRTREILESFCRELVPLLPAYGIGKGADTSNR